MKNLDSSEEVNEEENVVEAPVVASAPKAKSKAKKSSSKKKATKSKAKAATAESQDSKELAPVESLPSAESSTEEQYENNADYHKAESENSPEFLNLQISKTLWLTLKKKASEEGISPEDLAREFISEGLVLRAWEIMTRSKHISKPAQNNYKNNNNNQNRNRNGNRNQNYNQQRGNGNNRRNGNTMNPRSQQDIHSLLDDKAGFMEYVRNQERKKGNRR